MNKEAGLNGGCLCGAIRYETRARPFAADYCHCRMCQRTTGAPVSSWMDFMADQVHWVTRTTYTEFESSADIRRGFCNKCGSTLTYRSVSHPEYLSLAITSLDNPEDVHPTYHIYTDSQLPWLLIDDACDRYAAGKTA